MRLVICCLVLCFSAVANSICPTYFSYDAAQLKQLYSTESLSEEELALQQQDLKKIYATYHPDHFTFFRLLTYLAIARKEAAFLSYQLKGCFEGSLNPLYSCLVHLFFPNVSSTIAPCTDPYSIALAQVVCDSFKKRYEKQLKHPEILPEPAGWNIDPSHRQIYPYWCPAIVADLTIAAPSSNKTLDWKTFKSMRRKLSSKQQKAALAWEHFYTLDPKGKTWLFIAEHYMQEENIYLAKQLDVMATLAMAIFDALEGTFRAKFYYGVFRPFQEDPTLIPLIYPPSSPSYPSGHAAMAAAAYEVLSFYFPENTKQWKQLAEECALSRVWAGVHFPEDVKAGWDYGACLAKRLLSNQLQ